MTKKAVPSVTSNPRLKASARRYAPCPVCAVISKPGRYAERIEAEVHALGREVLGQDLPLNEHDWCLLQGIVQWPVQLTWKKRALGESRTVLAAGATCSVLSAASAGLGITALPCDVGGGDKRLARVSPPLEHLDMELWILIHPGLRNTVRKRALMEFRYDAFRRERDLFEGNRPQRGARILYRPPA